MTTIRAAVEADLPAIVAIYNTAIPGRMATADLDPVSSDSRLGWFHQHSHHHPLWVMELDQAIVGWLGFQPFYGRPAYRATVELSLYVSPSHSRRGFGRQLLQEAIDRSPTLGFTTLLGFIFAHNEPSLRLFQGAGFQQWGYLPQVAELDGIQRDLVILGCRISEGENPG